MTISDLEAIELANLEHQQLTDLSTNKDTSPTDISWESLGPIHISSNHLKDGWVVSVPALSANETITQEFTPHGAASIIIKNRELWKNRNNNLTFFNNQKGSAQLGAVKRAYKLNSVLLHGKFYNDWNFVFLNQAPEFQLPAEFLTGKYILLLDDHVKKNVKNSFFIIDGKVVCKNNLPVSSRVNLQEFPIFNDYKSEQFSYIKRNVENSEYLLFSLI